jgi:CRISPR-associated endonuclease Cas1
VTDWLAGLAAPLGGGGAAAADATAPEKASVHILCRDGEVSLADGMLALKAPGRPAERVRIGEVAAVSLHGTAAITSPCLGELMRRGVPVVWRSAGGYYLGQASDLSGAATAVRRAQYRAADNPARAFAIAGSLVSAKIVNQRGLLRRNRASTAALAEMQAHARRTKAATSHAELMGAEGAAAAAFYAALPAMIVRSRRADFPFDGRRRRPPTDPINCLLSYLYAVVAGECATAALAVGFDPAVGFLHAARPGRPALALDLMEPFRPLVADATALAAINRGEIRPAHFERREDAIRLSDSGRRALLAALERRLGEAVPERAARAGRLTWREAIAVEARALAAALRNDAGFAALERP